VFVNVRNEAWLTGKSSRGRSRGRRRRSSGSRRSVRVRFQTDRSNGPRERIGHEDGGRSVLLYGTRSVRRRLRVVVRTAPTYNTIIASRVRISGKRFSCRLVRFRRTTTVRPSDISPCTISVLSVWSPRRRSWAPTSADSTRL